MDASSIIAGLVSGAVGTGLFLYGKKERRWPQMATGLVLCVMPAVGGATTTLLVSAALVAAMTLAVRYGL